MRAMRPDVPMMTFEASPQSQPDEQRIAAFGRALDALHREVLEQLGEEDVRQIEQLGKISDVLELLGRGLIQLSFEPLGFSLGTLALWLHKSIEVMGIGHPVLHGSYDALSPRDRYHSRRFRWKSAIDEASWRNEHNLRHHVYTNIVGRDPDLNFGHIRLSARVPYRPSHALQPISNVLLCLAFTTGINLHVTGIFDLYFKQSPSEILRDREPATVRGAKRAFLSKFLRHYAKEYVLFPLLAGPFFPKVLLANLISEVGRDLVVGAAIFSEHVGAGLRDYPGDSRPGTRAEWYARQAEATRNTTVPPFISLFIGGVDRHIEHHLFPRLPPNRLREISPRVRAICEAHGIGYLEEKPLQVLRSTLRELARVSRRGAAPA
jgi:linoleoyl-CoA desaturase